MSIVDLPLELDAEAQLAAVYAEMATAFPGWEANPANPETFFAQAIVYRLIIPLAQLSADVGSEVFNVWGQTIIGLAPVVDTPATVASTWTMVDDAGYTIPADSQVSVAVTGDQSIGFRVVGEVLVAPGETETGAGEVLLEALVEGTDGNDLSGTAQLVDALVGIASIALVGSSAGGLDAEDPDAYLVRLRDTIQTLGPHPILARDVATLARNITGVSRCTVGDNFDPDSDDADDQETWISEKHTSFAVIDEVGANCSSDTQDAVLADLQAKREANFVFHAVDAEDNPIDVNFQIVPRDGFDQTATELTVVDAISLFLDPATWGQSPAQFGGREWENTGTVRFQDLVGVVDNVRGVDHYTVLKLCAGGGSLGTADVVMTGAFPLPSAGTVQVGS